MDPGIPHVIMANMKKKFCLIKYRRQAVLILLIGLAILSGCRPGVTIAVSPVTAASTVITGTAAVIPTTPTAGAAASLTPAQTTRSAASSTTTIAPSTAPAAVSATTAEIPRPADFIAIQAVICSAQYDIRYYTGNNFIGRRIDGYLGPEAFLTLQAVEALNKAAEKLYDQGYLLLIYDAYRPQRAVNDFVRWTEDPNDILNKAAYYPDLDKSKLIERGFIARRSAHSRGSTVDLTLLTMAGKPVDMGSPFDFFGPISYHDTSLISTGQLKNRNILRQAMKASGFKDYQYEWWHYQLIKEPYPSTYFDFPVK